MHEIKGVFSASLTPINEDSSINLHLFFEHCKFLLTQGLDGIGVFGTTGEASSFSVSEKIKAIEYLINSKITSKIIYII